jgi:hypothetical protein
MQFYCQNTIRPKKDTKLCLRVGITSFFNFYTELAESSFLCRFRVESINVFILPRFDLCHAYIFFINKQFRTCANVSRMSSLSGRMNIARVNIDTLLDAGRWFSPGIPVSSTYKSGIKHHKTNQPIIMSFIIIHDSSKVIKLANSVIHMLPIRQSHSLRGHGHFDFRIPG